VASFSSEVNPAPVDPPGDGGTAIDLSNCDREPIHVPGAIQPHGVLVVLREPELTIVQASESTMPLLGIAPDALLGQPVERMLGEDAAGILRAALVERNPAALNPIRLLVPQSTGVRAWDGIAHRAPGGLILELEPGTERDPRSVAGLFDHVRQALARLQATRSLPDLCDAIAEEIHRLTGLDRVMVYRFDPEWNGEVIAEARAEGVDGFLGLRFPASDIPAQARELYRRNWLRLIADASYRPAPIVPASNPDTGTAVDLSGSTLRSVSPVHLEYLRNMDVGASMSVSLLREGELWGLIACHHRTSKYVPYEVRTACEFLGQTFSVQLGTLVDEEDRGQALHLATLGARLLDRAASHDDWVQGLTRGEPTLAELAAAGGAAVWAGGQCHGVDERPDDHRIAALVAWLEAQGRAVFHTEHLAGHFPEAAEYADVASGLIAAAIGRGRGDYLLWFRPEAVRTVEWAGNPAKPVHLDTTPPERAGDHAAPVPRLHPRRSFAAWSETVRARSLAWRAAEIRAATGLRDRIVDIVLRQTDELARLNAELRRSNEELEAFTYIASHDLKEPLRGIQAFARMLLADLGDQLDAEGTEQLNTVVRLAERMDGMLDAFLSYSRAGQLELRLVEADMQQILAEVLDTLHTRIEQAAVEIRVPRPLPVVLCNPVRAASVLQNLVSNAIKYNDKPEPWIEIGYREPADGGPTVFHVRDNGIGIQPQHFDVIFRLFRRLHARERFSGGTGAGLTIARRLVERHGGRLWLESAPGEGTTFFFTLAQENRAGRPSAVQDV
jgi:two-component system, chemotaxis family, sensor kinase Cph1